MKHYLAILVAVLSLQTSFSQTSNSDSLNIRINANSEKKISHLVSVQANQLLQQLFSFGSTPAVNNPFLIKYSLRSNKSNMELNFGFGLNTFNNENVSGLKTSFRDLSFRAGYGKNFQIGKRFEVGTSLDLTFFNNQSNSEFSQESGNFFGTTDSTFIKTSVKDESIGGGPRVSIAFYVNKKIRIGTEATYYFLYSESSTESSEVLYRIDNSGIRNFISSREVSDSNKGTSFTFNLPVALFLTIRF